MSEGIISLRQLFDIDPNDVSALIAPGIDANEAAEKIHQQVRKGARLVRWAWVKGLVSEQVASILDLNVLDVLIDAWKKYDEVMACANQKPGDAALVPLIERTLKSEHHPYIEVVVGDQPAGRITFDLDFSLTLSQAVLTIKGARILEVETGSVTGEMSLSLKEVELVKRETRPLKFPGKISLGAGIALPPPTLSATA